MSTCNGDKLWKKLILLHPYSLLSVVSVSLPSLESSRQKPPTHIPIYTSLITLPYTEKDFIKFQPIFKLSFTLTYHQTRAKMINAIFPSLYLPPINYDNKAKLSRIYQEDVTYRRIK